MPGNFNIQKVLVAPLDWGLGHATRCIPLIRALILNGCEVLYAAEGSQAALLKKEFPQLECLPLQGYRIRYGRSRFTLVLRMLVQIPGLMRSVRSEHIWLQKVINEHNIDLVISDNRYGLYSSQIPCVFITHQLTIKAPFAIAERLLQKINYRYLNRFTQCWVPDAEGDQNLAGVLSHPVKKPSVPLRYIGLLSRFSETVFSDKRYDYCIMLSGPEPQRSILEKKILRDIGSVKGKILLVRGLPGDEADQLSAPEQVTVKNHLRGDEMQQVIAQSECIVCRGGYSTLMELAALNKKALLIPTPGQTEQEYLAARLNNMHACVSVPQALLEVPVDFERARKSEYLLPSLIAFREDDIRVLLKELSAY